MLGSRLNFHLNCLIMHFKGSSTYLNTCLKEINCLLSVDHEIYQISEQFVPRQHLAPRMPELQNSKSRKMEVGQAVDTTLTVMSSAAVLTSSEWTFVGCLSIISQPPSCFLITAWISQLCVLGVHDSTLPHSELSFQGQIHWSHLFI